MAKVRLLSGIIEAPLVAVSDPVSDGAECVKNFLLCYEGKFESMDGEVEVKKSHLDKIAANYNDYLDRMAAKGEIERSLCAPLQLDHTTSAKDTVGRMTHKLHVAPYITEDGEVVNALYGPGTILGRENVEKANDGRYGSVSIGADFENGILSELTITPFPAAEDARILRLSKWKKLSEGGSMDKEKLKKYLMEACKMSAEDADKKLSEAGDEEMKKMSAEMDEHEKKMSAESDEAKAKLAKKKLEEEEEEKKKAELSKKKMNDGDADQDDVEKKKELADKEEKEKLAKKKLEEDEKKAKEEKLSAKKANFIKLAKGFKTASATIKLATRKAQVVSRLAALRKEGKVSPAELKGFKVDEIAQLDEKATEVLFGTLSQLSKKLDDGVQGTTKAQSIDKVRNEFRLARLELETRLNMPMKRAQAEKDLKELAAKEAHAMRLIDGGASTIDLSAYDSSYEKIAKMIDDGAKGEELKSEIKRFMSVQGSGGADFEGAIDEKRMSAIANEVETLQTGYKELVSLVASDLGVTAEELE